MPEQVESAMSQLRFSEAEYAGKGKKTRRELFLGEMDQVLGAERVFTHRADWRVTRLW